MHRLFIDGRREGGVVVRQGRYFKGHGNSSSRCLRRPGPGPPVFPGTITGFWGAIRHGNHGVLPRIEGGIRHVPFPGIMAAMDDETTQIYASVGGDAPFFALVEAFYAGVETDPVLRPL